METRISNDFPFCFFVVEIKNNNSERVIVFEETVFNLMLLFYLSRQYSHTWVTSRKSAWLPDKEIWKNKDKQEKNVSDTSII